MSPAAQHRRVDSVFDPHRLFHLFPSWLFGDGRTRGAGMVRGSADAWPVHHGARARYRPRGHCDSAPKSCLSTQAAEITHEVPGWPSTSARCSISPR